MPRPKSAGASDVPSCWASDGIPSARKRLSLFRSHFINMAPRDDLLLGGLGIGEDEERLYEVLLDAPGASEAELLDRSGMPKSRVRRGLERLSSLGLISRSIGRPIRFTPAPPEIALEGLIVGKQRQLDSARLRARALEEKFRNSRPRTGPMDIIEIIDGQSAVAQRFAQLLGAATEEVLMFDCPPYASSQPDYLNTGNDAVSRGVQYRTIYDRRSLEVPGRIADISASIAVGEAARVHPRVPLKLAIVDRRVGLMPLVPEPDDLQGALLLHSSPLLGALVLLWEVFWARAIPFEASSEEAPTSADVSLSLQEQRLAALLLAGFKAVSIARQLELGTSTVERHIKQLMDKLSADTRVQLGYQLAHVLPRNEGES